MSNRTRIQGFIAFEPKGQIPIHFRPALSVFFLFLILAGCGSGSSSEGENASAGDEAELDTDNWNEFRGGAEFDTAEVDALRERLSRVQSLGYVAGVRDAEGVADSVTYIDPDQAWGGYNLYVSEGLPEARLIDMLGNTIHTWRKDLQDVWNPERLEESPELERWIPESPEDLLGKNSWHRGFLLPDGGLIALYKDIGLISIDRDSELRWSRVMGAHHDLDVGPEGRIYVILSEPRVMERIHAEEPQLDDLIAVLTPDGDELRRISIYDALIHSDFAHLLDECDANGDPFHTNSIQVMTEIPKTDPPLPEAFTPGALLVSVRDIDLVGIIDPEQEVFTWVQMGPWRAQHDAQLTKAGTLTIFDNWGNVSQFGRSRIVEFDPARNAIAWEYGGNEQNHFYSRRRGNTQRLRNGNTLINEADNGRVFEVRPDGEIVWEFVNPLRGGEDNRLISAFRSFERVDAEAVDLWLNPSPSNDLLNPS